MLRGILLTALWSVVEAGFEGDNCIKDGINGVCKNLKNCPSAIQDLVRRRIHPQICGFDKFDSIVCCIDNVATAAPLQTHGMSSSLPPQWSSETKVNNSPESSVEDFSTEDFNSCPPIDNSLTTSKTGRKAWDKCLEYQEKLAFPCETSNTLDTDILWERKNKCHMNVDELIVGGENASRNEFPHMALLGFGDEPNTLWLCGGSLISETFILTAGHCTGNRYAGPVTYAYIGILAKIEVEDITKRYKIKTIHRYPEYKPPQKYHDIALLELEKSVPLNEWIKPACLHTGDLIADEKVWATGWGHTYYKDSSGADVLQKVQLNKYSIQNCKLRFPPARQLNKGFDENTQMCYGDLSQSKDTCQGDSGGPLQIKHGNINCMFLIVGVTSYGKACGFIDEPGVYTKVSHYVPWIESIVWP